jgi:hypothetical protein
MTIGGDMPGEKSEKRSLKQEVAHELKELSVVTAYLALLFCSLAAYSMLLLNAFQNSYFAYGSALINALVIAKVILIGQAARAGTKFESKALLYSALWKAFVFAWLVFAFHLLEEMIKDLMHGAHVAAVLHDIRIRDLLARTVLIFCAFIPLFIFLELRRAMGQADFGALLLHSASSPNRQPPNSF